MSTQNREPLQHSIQSPQLATSGSNRRLPALIALAALLVALPLAGCNPGVDSSTTPAVATLPALSHTPLPTTSTGAPTATQPSLPTATQDTLTTRRETPLSLPTGLTVEEYTLAGPPSIEPRHFTPFQASETNILARRAAWRDSFFPDNIFFEGMHYSMRAMLSAGELVATQYFNQTGTDSWVAVQLDGEEIYRISTGPSSPLNPLRGLWAYEDTWVLETAQITRREAGNTVYTDAAGQISQDGVLLNAAGGYQEMFGFQLIAGRPFYFFKLDDLIGFSYSGHPVAAGYTEIPHYLCCSAAELNPLSATNIVAFFAQREGIWYYVEIGVYESP